MEENNQVKTLEIPNETENMYLDFIVDEAIYGIEIKYVLQIVGMQKINEMPEMPPHIKGFINLRGSVIPLCSMHIRFNKPEPAYTDRTCIIVIAVADKQVGLIVDAIQETVTIEPENISPPPSVGTAGASFYVQGVARLPDGEPVILIDISKFICTDDYQEDYAV